MGFNPTSTYQYTKVFPTINDALNFYIDYVSLNVTQLIMYFVLPPLAILTQIMSYASLFSLVPALAEGEGGGGE